MSDRFKDIARQLWNDAMQAVDRPDLCDDHYTREQFVAMLSEVYKTGLYDAAKFCDALGAKEDYECMGESERGNAFYYAAKALVEVAEGRRSIEVDLKECDKR